MTNETNKAIEALEKVKEWANDNSESEEDDIGFVYTKDLLGKLARMIAELRKQDFKDIKEKGE